ncbi:ATP-binding cassette domain-containing protein [Embleya sp. NPDC050154]|uniref:ATP-binding cassette domain-containing protein n=1 Tax=unclassified Embleya TaxID=2699296 RepID=UPI0037B3B5C9
MIAGSDWLGSLASELRLRGLPADQVARVLDETRAHLWEAGEDPLRAFGTPSAYAAAVYESLGTPPTPVKRRVVPSEPPRLQASGIGKRHGRRPLLDDVNLTVHAGEVAAVVGANGCGKSTFLRICAGLERAHAGRIVVRGSIGYCPQGGGTSDFLTPDEHFALVGAGRGLSRNRSRGAGRAMAEHLRWPQPAPTAAARLSGGTRQKLEVVLTALGDPDVLLLDEPYQGFDHGSYTHFWDQVREWANSGRAVVVVTHLLDRLERADTVVDLTPRHEAAPALRGRHHPKGTHLR